MNRLRKILSFIFALLFIVSCVACSAGTEVPEKDDVTSSPTTTAPSVTEGIQYEPDDLPELDFGGETVTILSPASKVGGFNFHETNLTVEELSSDVLNDSIYNRELYVEERLGVEIENIKTLTPDRDIEKVLSTGDDTYDAVVSSNTFMSSRAIEGYLLDLYDVEYIDLDKPWWSQNFTEEAEFFGSIYMATGAMFQSLIRGTYVVFYNKNLALDYADSIPELNDLYGLVDSGRWTIDMFIELGGGIYNDINGNDMRDLEDVYGIAYDKYTPINAFWSGFDISVFSRTDDGWFEFDVNTDRMYTALNKLYTMLYEVKGSIIANVGTTSEDSYSCDYPEVPFSNGTNMFLVERIGFADKESLRNMQDDYGILPYPKYDEEQKDYHSFSNSNFGAVGIPIFNTNPDVAGAVFEAMASYSYRETRPLYLDTVLKGQYMSDPDSRRMVDIVVDGITIDAAFVFFDTLSNKYTEKFQIELFNGERSFATIHEANRKKVETVLKTYKKQLEK